MNLRLPIAFLTMCMSLAALSACGSSDDSDTTPPASASESQSGTDTESDEGLYDAALKQFTAFESATASYRNNPRRDARAEQIYKTYWVDPDYQLKVLAALNRAKIKANGSQRVLRSESQRVASSRLEFRQCVDTSDVVVTRSGKRVSNGQDSPQWRYITMTRQSASLPWLIKELDENAGKARPCADQ